MVVGGDGMVHLALQALAGTETRLGLVPAGTGNDVARYFDIPRKDTAAATDVVIGGRERRIDLARTGGEVLRHRAGRRLRRRRQRAGQRDDLAAGPDALQPGHARRAAHLRPIPYVLELDGEEHRFEAMMVAVGNGPSFGGGLRITEGAVLDDGLLDVVVIAPMSKVELVRTYPKLFRGTHVHHPRYRHHRARRSPSRRPASRRTPTASGSPPLPLTVEVAPPALRVLVPMIGRSAEPRPPPTRYARSRRNRGHPMLADFASRHDFALDDFQVRACRELEEGRSVLVAAPTGSGKTIVGEFAVHLALATGRKAFYTTPIKALSNQKFHDLSKRYGAENVGLLTGDNSINGEAPVVVMTTEVLRNMLYAGSRTLATLGFVVMDEVHYLADRMRGAVWEEVIIHLPESVAVASLSATVSNAEEFGEWLGTVRGETTTIVEERRPVPLYQHVVVGRRMYDLFAYEVGTDPAELDAATSRRSTPSSSGWRATTGRAAG